MLLISPTVADEDVPGVVDQVTSFVTDRGGSVAEVKPWGRRRLAYHIRDYQEANYVITNLSMDPSNAKELESSLKISEDVIRHLLLRTES
jgi:small subunit ribosomal protein S6